MMNTYAKAETLTGAIFAPLDWVRSLALVLAFSLLTALAAQVVIPLPPVPITGQTFAVLLTGALLGSRLGALAMIAYLIEGACGLPFFYAGRGGLQHLLGPTAGYLWSFPAAAFVTGLLAERGWDRRFVTAAAAMALHEGVTKFLVGDIIKVALAAAVLPSGWAILRRRGLR